ncbi:hypothetical protein V1264_005149 [Littorina saxatilis]|uniref:Uncharacterized protein n=2 Tax=Littorina saxatilis TaxID=31220 RepID=A0AAN9B0Z1_9CAEN
MYARCLFPFLLLILIAGRNLILSDDRVYNTSRQLNTFETLNRRTRDIHLRPKDTRRKMTKRSRRDIWTIYGEELKEQNEIIEEHREYWTAW